MKKSEEVQIAKSFLRCSDLDFINDLISHINFTPKEKLIIIKSELDRFTLKEIAIELNQSFSTIVIHKKKALIKIYDYVVKKKLTI